VQPIFDICWSRQFIKDVKAIVGSLDVFDQAFSGGYDFNLARIPRGQGTWDLSGDGSYRLAHMAPHKLPDGMDVPAIYFTFRLHLDPAPTLVLLRAYRGNDPYLARPLLPASLLVLRRTRIRS
jgi:hypothetical protein